MASLARPVARCRCGYELLQDQQCPECNASFHKAFAHRRSSATWIASAVSLLLVFFFGPALMCACGHYSSFGLAFTGPIAGIAWWPFLFDRRGNRAARILAVIAVAIATLLLFRNVADVLWFGHEPML